MEQLWRIIRRLIFLGLTIFVSANAIAYFVLNNPLVHEWFRNQANQQLQKAGMELFIGPITVNFFETKLTVSRVKLSDVSNSQKEIADVEDFVIGFDPWRPNAYLIPSVKFISIQNWIIDVSVVEKLKGLSGEQIEKPQPVADIIAKLRSTIGRQIELKNGRLVKKLDTNVVSSVQVNSIFAKFEVNNMTKGLTLLADFGSSQICLSENFPCTKALSVDSLELNTEMDQEGGARVERLGIRSGFGSWQAGGQIKFGPQFNVLDYNLKVDGSADATPWFHLVGLQGQGRFSSSTYVSPEGGDASQRSGFERLTPVVQGQVSWSSLNLSGYDIYSGNAEFSYSDRKINYKNAFIHTPQGALIEARGQYDLRKEMPFVNTARIMQFPFRELMAGLGIPTDVIDFQMDTRELLVSGLLHPGDGRGFTLAISGLVDTTQIRVPTFEPNSIRLPDCAVQLKIDSDDNHMSFLGSSANCQGPDDDQLAHLILNRGNINYRTSTNDFVFNANSMPADLISYFVNEPVDGEINLNGRIYASQSAPVIFTADVQLNDAEVFGLVVSRASGRIKIDQGGFSGEDVEAWLESDDQSPSLSAKNVYLGFANEKIDIDGKYNGKIADLLSVFGEQGRVIAGQTKGELSVSQFKLKGDRKNLLKANLDLRLRARQIKSPWLSAGDLQSVFVCQQGWCSGSRVYLQNLSFGSIDNEDRNAMAIKSGLPRSKAIIEVESFSKNSLSTRFELQSVPLRYKSAEKDIVTGVVDLRAALQGGLKDWEVSAQGRADKLVLYGTPVGSLALNAASHGGGPLNVVLSGLFDQLQARAIMDHSFEKSTQLFVNLRSFELFRYLPNLGQSSSRFSGEAAANFSADGPGLKAFMRDSESAFESLTGRGQLSRLRVQVGRESMALASPVALQLNENSLSFSTLRLSGDLGKIDTQGKLMIDSGLLAGTLNAQIDAAIIPQISDVVSQSSGEISLQGDFERSETSSTFRGEAKIENVSLGGKYISPPLTSMNGRVVFEDSRIEIPLLTAAKGNGQVDFIGTIELPSGVEGAPTSPSVALRANLKSAQFRWPQELFETVETTLDGQVELSGTGRPLSLIGDLRVAKGRAYRDATCQDFIRNGTGGSEVSISKPQNPLFRLNLSIEADSSFTLQSTCIRGRVSTAVRLTGSETEPILSGQMRLDNGVLNLLKTRFEVMRAEAVFDNIVKIEPRIDAQMMAKIEKYSVFVGAEGPFSRPRLNIWSDPSNGPDGNPLSRPALIRMISTGRGPSETTQTAVTQAIANQFVGLFDDPLSQVVSKITRGIVERFELQPIIDGGQSSFRARASRDLGEKFNLGLDYEPNRQSLTGTIFINESVNVLGGFDRRSSQFGSYSELSGGFRFQFGGK